MRDLVIFGASSFAEIAAIYFERTKEYKVAAFIVDDGYQTVQEFQGRPLIQMSEFVRSNPSKELFFHVAATYTNLNQLRFDKVAELTAMGLQPASYISPHSYVDPTARIGQHAFIFEHNTIQPFVEIGDRVVLWSGNHIGHHSIIESDVFVASHVVISGHCRIGEFSFLGVNCSIGNNVTLGKRNWIVPGTVILANTGQDEMWRPQKPVLSQPKPVE